MGQVGGHLLSRILAVIPPKEYSVDSLTFFMTFSWSLFHHSATVLRKESNFVHKMVYFLLSFDLSSSLIAENVTQHMATKLYDSVDSVQNILHYSHSLTHPKRCSVPF